MAQAELPEGFRRISGKRSPPRNEQRFEVMFRNGYIDQKHSYTASQLNWIHDGGAWDIIAVREAE